MDAPRINAVPVTIALLVGTALCLLVAFNLLWAFSWRDTTPRGPLVAVSDWPRPIQDLHRSLTDADLNTETFSVYLLYGQPAQTLSTVVCRIAVDDGEWNTIQQQLDLQPIPESNVEWIRDSIASLAEPSWWPSASAAAKYYASARLLAGDEADLYYAAHDEASSRAFIHYHFNF